VGPRSPQQVRATVHNSFMRLLAAVSVACAASLWAFADAVVAGGEGAPMEQPPSDRRASLDSGPCEAAESAARALVAARTATNGERSPEVAAAQDGLVEALLRNGKGTQPSTLELAQRLVRGKEADLAPDALDLPRSLRNLGDVLVAAGEYQNAIPLFRRALAIRENARGKNDVSVAESLDDLAYVLLLIQRYEEARQTLDRALATQEPLLDASHQSIARTLERFGLLFHKQASYAAARPVLERALTIRESAGPGNPDLPETLYLYGDQFWFEGNFPTARDFYVRAAGAAETTCGEGHPRLAVYLRNVAAALAVIGDLSGAITTGERGLRIAVAQLGADDPEVAMTLNGLGIRKKSLGNYAEARELYERALAIATRRFGRDHDLVATLVHNLAVLSAEIGDFAEAKRQEDRAVAIWERVFEPGHPFVATAVTTLADALSDQGRYVEARALYERALAIREQKLQPGHRDLASTQMDVARTLFRLGEVRRAMDLSERALASLERRDIPDDLTLARAAVTRADLELASGDSVSARAHYERGLAIRERILGKSNPLVAEARSGLGAALARLGDNHDAFEQALQAEAIGRTHLTLTLRYLSERQSLGYAAKRPKALDLALSLTAPADQEAGGRVFDALIRSRALVLDEMAARRRVSTDASRPDVAPLWAALASTRQRLANLVVRGPSEQRPQQYVAIVEEARHEKELAERALAGKSAAFNTELAQADVGLDKVRAALPPDSALVSFIRYDRTLANQTPPPDAGSTRSIGAVRSPRAVPSYLAFVMRREGPPSVIELDRADIVDGLVARWRDEVVSGPFRLDMSPRAAEASYRTAAMRLRRKVWDSIASQLTGIARVFVVPDGSLNVVALDALPVDRTKYVIDEGRIIHYLSAERDLVSAAAPFKAGRGLLAVGGPAFGDSRLAARPSSRSATVTSSDFRGLRSSCGTFKTLDFDPLPASRLEADQVVRLWAAEGEPAQVLSGRDATERLFKQRAPGSRVLHVATHGFFLGDCPSALDGTRPAGGQASRGQGQRLAGVGENPLLLSGLALAGANRRAAAAPGEEDGILTAEEVAALNLEGVEWAVLSACDTGLGEIKAGEGVLGLRRAFQIAGARTVIMSLWSIDDEAAQAWMRALYKARFSRRFSTADAMHDAGLTVLRARRARGYSTHPFYWAGFVAAGDWR
jgi:CHAT domain-containing protein/predicted negative regulator of RcsB-dependent stress response